MKLANFILIILISFLLVACQSNTQEVNLTPPENKSDIAREAVNKNDVEMEGKNDTPIPTDTIDSENKNLENPPNQYLYADDTTDVKKLFDFLFEEDSIKIINKVDQSSTICTIPNKLTKVIRNNKIFESIISISNLKDIKDLTNDNTAKTSYSIKVKLGEVEYISGDIEDRYIDIAKIYIYYENNNKNQIKDIEIIPKYNFSEEEHQQEYELDEAYIAEACLFDTIDGLGEEAKKYSDEIMCDFEYKGMKIEIMNYRISTISVANDDVLTPRGLKVGDSKERARELYGLPDVGYFENDTWIYLFFRDWLDDGESTILSDDYFQIIFKGNIVDEIILQGYIPID
jgi:hypothetical protein